MNIQEIFSKQVDTGDQDQVFFFGIETETPKEDLVNVSLKIMKHKGSLESLVESFPNNLEFLRFSGPSNWPMFRERVTA
jgi:hypothetical protein